MNKIVLILSILLILNSCSEFLDIVPERTATISTSFTLRNSAEKFLFTCYSFLPPEVGGSNSPAIFSGGEAWNPYAFYSPINAALRYAGGENTNVNPLLNVWDGKNGASYNGFIAIRDCNIFLDNISMTADIGETERQEWIGEVKFLKAYYLFRLLIQYGPIPLMKENIPTSTTIDEFKDNFEREPIDSCFNYIVDLLGEAISVLPVDRKDQTQLGRITELIAMTFKAKVLTFWASPLFNGNTDYPEMTNSREEPLFNPSYIKDRWKAAVEARKEAIRVCDSLGVTLSFYQPAAIDNIHTDSTMIKLNIRTAITDDNWSPEIIWGDTRHAIDQGEYLGLGIGKFVPTDLTIKGNFGASLEFANLFYTDKGLPIEEDNTWDFDGRYNLKIAQYEDRYNIKEGYTTAGINFGREPRYYADLGFDGATWFGQGEYNDNNQWFIEGKSGQRMGYNNDRLHNATGIWIKKLVNLNSEPTSVTSASLVRYPFPILRLADLYLLYAEALNEYNSGPTDEVYEYINRIRSRAGLPSIQDSWGTFSRHPDKHLSEDGMREIIQRERTIELAFEGKYFWDVRRWKTAEVMLNRPVTGWNFMESEPENYYKKQIIHELVFEKKNYFDPIDQNSILIHPILIQNSGW